MTQASAHTFLISWFIAQNSRLFKNGEWGDQYNRQQTRFSPSSPKFKSWHLHVVELVNRALLRAIDSAKLNSSSNLLANGKLVLHEIVQDRFPRKQHYLSIYKSQFITFGFSEILFDYRQFIESFEYGHKSIILVT